MNALQKKLGLTQFLYFVAVVGVLGVPYLLFALEMTPAQMKQLLITYAWEGILFCGICTWLPMRLARVIPTYEKPFVASPSEETTYFERVLTPAFRLPQRAAIVSLEIIVFAFAIGVLQLAAFARFDLIQSIQGLVAGVIIGVVYAICTFLNIERAIAPYLGKMVHQSGVSSPPRVLSIFSKVMIVCVGIMFVAVLFEVSVSYRHSVELLESELSKAAILELGRIKTSRNWDSLTREETGNVLGFLKVLDSKNDAAFFILDRQGTMLSQNLPPLVASIDPKTMQDLFETLGQHPVHKDIINKLLFCAVFLKDGERMLIRVIDVVELEKLEASFLKRALMASGIILIVALFLSYGLASSVSVPLKNINEAAERIGRGEFGVHPVTGSGDEVGTLAYSFFRMEGALKKIILKVKEAAAKLNSTSNEIVAASEEQASGASQQASNVSETTAALEELSATARQIAENSEAQEGMAESTLKNAEDSLKAMAKAEAVMSEIRSRTETSARKIMDLGEKSQKIGKVLGIINEIAAETKMLSLNAAIEASRAGEAGKGFSVVAAEIRKLAENVVKSTGSIEEMLKEIQGAANTSVMASEENVKIVGTGAQELERVKTALEEIVHLAEQATNAAREVSMTTGQQKIASEQTAAAMREISEVARQTADVSAQTTTSVKGLHRLAKELKNLVSAFRVASEPERDGMNDIEKTGTV